MKKILIFSDTHGDTNAMIDILNAQEKVDAIIHAGDHARDAEDIEAIFNPIPTYYVSGNCDFYSSFAPGELFIELFKKKFFITHGHTHNVKNEVNISYPTLARSGITKCADVTVFGHTHIPHIDYYKGMAMVNPGSLKYSRTYSVCEIDGDKVYIKNLKMV